MQNPFITVVMIGSVTDVDDWLADVEKLTSVKNNSDSPGETLKYKWTHSPGLQYLQALQQMLSCKCL